MRVTVTTTRYEVSNLPLGHIDYNPNTALTVEWVGVPWQLEEAEKAAYNTMWRIRRGGYAMNRDGKLNFEPQPSSRSVEWCREHSFSLDMAITMATTWVELHS